ncbi:hypothetical protein EH228_14360 [Erwinia endophytica]|uniref:hypothetical protein n=1 Tax=Erwinia endophytica TaxID=1563158 RepID=UPI001265F2A8|nr:hypothetical protein [Erwinia endophytica]KAB8307885.1 hypothetical protein EH228_14360 [Erwinia endophytica]
MLTRKISLSFAFLLAATFSQQVSAHAHLKNQMMIPWEKSPTHGHYQVNGLVLSVDGHKAMGNDSCSVK